VEASHKAILEQFINSGLKPKFNIEEFLFKEQLDFVKDEARFATAVCSVRAGKTTACAADLINTAMTMPGTIGLYITLARSSAKRIIWPDLHKINRDFKLNATPNEQDLSMKFPNGSIIYCSGASNEPEIEKFRGLSNVALAYIDESQAFRTHIKELVEEILVKRLYDTNGRCRLIGTPGPIPAGYFYEASQSNKWSHHAWTLHSNTWIERKSGKSVNELIQQDMDRKGVTIDDPSIQRECFGRWVLDANSLLLNYDPLTNHYDSLPEDKYEYILGIDLGVRDSDALCLLAYSPASPVTWLVEEIVTPNQLTDDLAAQIRKLERTYGPMTMVADAGGLGLKVVEDLMARYNFYIHKAEKQGKMADYKFLNNALRTGMFRAKKTTKFAEDCNILEKDIDKSTPEKIVVKGHSDAVDAALYAFGHSPAYNYIPTKFKAMPGSPEYIKEQEDLHKQAIAERIKREQAFKDPNAGISFFPKDNFGRDPWNNWD
jgi:hypothetical protein